MSWNWLTGFLNFEEPPPEPLVLGAELWCPYGSEHTYLILERDGFDIDNLPQANVDDCKKSVNIFPFGECAGGRLCEYKMKLARKWENPEPQTEIVNGKEVITTKSVLMCNAEGMEIQAATSGQEFGKSIAEQLNLKAEMDAKYPGLYDLLMDPYGSLYLNEGMYEKALAFLEDQVQEKGNIFLPTIFDGNDLKNEMVRLALGRLMPRCDVSTYDRFINGLEDTGVLTGMNEKEGWDVHYLNSEMMEMLWKDCKTTDERVKTDPVIRWQEENRVFTSSMSDAMTQLSKAVVMYLASQSQPAEKTGEKPLSKIKEKVKDRIKDKFEKDYEPLNPSAKIKGNSYDINKLQKTQPYTYPENVSSIKRTIVEDGPNSVPPIKIRVHHGQVLVVDGHHRLEAFRQLGYDRVPIKYLHGSQLGKTLTDGTYYRSIQELLEAAKICN